MRSGQRVDLRRYRPLIGIPQPVVAVARTLETLDAVVDREEVVWRPEIEIRDVLVEDLGRFRVDPLPLREIVRALALDIELVERRIRVVGGIRAGRRDLIGRVEERGDI